jgi:lipid-A-disaccharide synthase
VSKRIFISTGEASGELLAVELADAMRARDPDLQFEGIGGKRMHEAGFTLRWTTHGWASMGPIEALGRIPKLLAIVLQTSTELRARPPDLIVFVDFGAFNLRFARQLRRIGYRGPMLYYFPPGAWLDDPKRARMVAAATTALTPFAHQRDFYASLGLPIAYLGHPLVSTIPPAAVKPPAPARGGRVAILPGSRRGELARHGRLLLEAARLLRTRRPELEVVIGAADDDGQRQLRALAAQFPELPVAIVHGARAALAGADAAWSASGTAVLEAALCGVPTVCLYIVSRAQERIARRVFTRIWRPYIALPNLVLDRPVIPEFLQERATQSALVEALEQLLAHPEEQQRAFGELREALGPPDALERAAAFALELTG